MEKTLPVVPVVNAGEVGRSQSCADPAANAREVGSRLKPSIMES